MKYDRIVEMSQAKSQQKVLIAKREIEKMLERRERITVAALIRYTGLSKGFFYQNAEVRQILDDALLRQGEAYNPKKVIFDKAMEETIRVLKIEVKKLKQDNVKLKNENEKLKEEIQELQRKIELI